MKKKILLLDTGKEWGGGTNSMIELLKRIDRERFDVTCCFYANYLRGDNGHSLASELSDIGIPLILLPRCKMPLWAKLAKELARLLFFWEKRLRQRCVRTMDLHWQIIPQAKQLQQVIESGSFRLLYMNNHPSTNLEGYFAAEMAKIPIVQHCRVKPTLHVGEAKIVNRSINCIICVSHDSADALASYGVDRRRVSVVHNAIDCQQQLPRPARLLPPPSGIVVGTTGRLTSLKSVAHLIMAIAVLLSKNIEVTCLILGEGPQRGELEALAAQLEVDEHVRFVGFQADPLAWVQAMDICILCSSSEGLPRTILEAMLVSKPVIGSNVAGTRELIVDGETGLLYDYGNVQALAMAIQRLSSEPLLREKMGHLGRRRVVTHFSIEAYVAGVSKILEDGFK